MKYQIKKKHAKIKCKSLNNNTTEKVFMITV